DHRVGGDRSNQWRDVRNAVKRDRKNQGLDVRDHFGGRDGSRSSRENFRSDRLGAARVRDLDLVSGRAQSLDQNLSYVACADNANLHVESRLRAIMASWVSLS